MKSSYEYAYIHRYEYLEWEFGWVRAVLDFRYVVFIPRILLQLVCKGQTGAHPRSQNCGKWQSSLQSWIIYMTAPCTLTTAAVAYNRIMSKVLHTDVDNVSLGGALLLTTPAPGLIIRHLQDSLIVPLEPLLSNGTLWQKGVSFTTGALSCHMKYQESWTRVHRYRHQS